MEKFCKGIRVNVRNVKLEYLKSGRIHFSGKKSDVPNKKLVFVQEVDKKNSDLCHV